MGTLYMFAPGLAACVVQKAYRERVAAPLGVSFRINRWFLIGWLTPPALAIAAVGMSLVMPGVHLTLDPVHANIFDFIDHIFPWNNKWNCGIESPRRRSIRFYLYWWAVCLPVRASMRSQASVKNSAGEGFCNASGLRLAFGSHPAGGPSMGPVAYSVSAPRS